MAVDNGVFDRIKTFTDYQKADQAFQIQRALQQQQLQSGGIDAQSKANVYATQVLSGAVAGGQGAYDQARQSLAQQGIDVSNWAPDVATGAQQAQAARLAQSPLGSLLNAGMKAESNNIAATQAMGSVGAGMGLDPLSQSLMGKIIPAMSGGAPQAAPNGPPPMPSSAAPVPQQAPTTDVGALPAILPAAGPAAAQASPMPTPQVARFSPPPQNPGETIGAYNQRVQQAFEAYKSDPNYVAAQATASETGKARADAAKAAVGANANYDQVVQTINGIKDLVNSPVGLPQDRYGLPAGARASIAQNLGGTTIGNMLGIPPQALADNSNAFTKLNEAQTIGAIKELASTGQIRMTRTLENILNRGYLIEPGASATSKNQQANVILAELNNSKIAAQNVDAGLNGGQATPYQQMPAPPNFPGDIPPPPPPPVVTPVAGQTMTSPTGTYLFNGGDPSDKSNWKKVK